MLKKIMFIFALGLLALFSITTKAQDLPTTENTGNQELSEDEMVSSEALGINEPNLLPSSPFYFLKNWKRTIEDVFTVDKVKKAELRLEQTAEKLLELRKMAEKTNDSGLLEKATENYEKQMEKMEETVDKIKEKTSENPEIGKFLDKFTKQQILQQKVLDKLAEKVPDDVFDKIEQARERHLEKFSEVMEKLDASENISERLKNVLNEIKGSEFKDIKNMEILKRLEEKSPEEIKEKIAETREKIIENIEEKLNALSPESQERLKNYIEEMKGTAENRMEVLENIRLEVKNNPELKEELKEVREKIIEQAQEAKEKFEEKIEEIKEKCPELADISKNFCENGRIIINRDENGCPVPSCFKIEAIPTSTLEKICTTIWNPVCGIDGKTYSNPCWAKLDDVKIAYRSECNPIQKNEGRQLKTLPLACTEIWEPVCGADNKTYGNSCKAKLAGVQTAYPGECQEGETRETLKEKLKKEIKEQNQERKNITGTVKEKISDWINLLEGQ